MQPAVEVVNLCKGYPGVVALKGVSFQLQKGTVAGLLGPNGSGKSTLFRIIAGQSKGGSGEVYINGVPAGPHTRGAVSYIPDYDHFYSWMRVDDLINFFAALYPSFRAGQTEEALEFMKLPRHRQIGKLSKGMRARLKIIMALSWEAELVLLDEPLSGIDPASREKMIEILLQACSGRERTFVIASHLVEEIEHLLSYGIFLEDGVVALQDEADAIRERYGASLDQVMRRELV